MTEPGEGAGAGRPGVQCRRRVDLAVRAASTTVFKRQSPLEA